MTQPDAPPPGGFGRPRTTDGAKTPPDDAKRPPIPVPRREPVPSLPVRLAFAAAAFANLGTRVPLLLDSMRPCASHEGNAFFSAGFGGIAFAFAIAALAMRFSQRAQSRGTVAQRERAATIIAAVGVLAVLVTVLHMFAELPLAECHGPDL